MDEVVLQFGVASGLAVVGCLLFGGGAQAAVARYIPGLFTRRCPYDRGEAAPALRRAARSSAGRRLARGSRCASLAM